VFGGLRLLGGRAAARRAVRAHVSAETAPQARANLQLLLSYECRRQRTHAACTKAPSPALPCPLQLLTPNLRPQSFKPQLFDLRSESCTRSLQKRIYARPPYHPLHAFHPAPDIPRLRTPQPAPRCALPRTATACAQGATRAGKGAGTGARVRCPAASRAPESAIGRCTRTHAFLMHKQRITQLEGA